MKLAVRFSYNRITASNSTFSENAEKAFIESGFVYGETKSGNNTDLKIDKWHHASVINTEIDLFSRLRVGLSFIKDSQEIFGNGYYNEGAYIATSVANYYVEYLLFRQSLIRQSRIECTIGGGFCTCNYFTARDLFDKEYISEYTGHCCQYYYTYEKNVTGKCLRFGVDLFLIDRISIPIRVEGRFIPGVTIPAFEQTGMEQGVEVTKHLNSFKVNASVVEWTIGLKLHL